MWKNRAFRKNSQKRRPSRAFTSGIWTDNVTARFREVNFASMSDRVSDPTGRSMNCRDRAFGEEINNRRCKSVRKFCVDASVSFTLQLAFADVDLLFEFCRDWRVFEVQGFDCVSEDFCDE